jgi:hypothetical protein
MADLLDSAVLRSEPGIDALAAAVRDEFQKAQAALANGVSHSMNAGDALIAARRKIGRGWQRWVQEACGLALSTAKLCVQLAQHRTEIEAAIQGGAELSLRGARSLISGSSRKSCKPGKETLEAHWKRATKPEREAFLDEIGVDAILRAMSADFGRDLRSRVPTPQPDHKRRKTLTLVANPEKSSFRH